MNPISELLGKCCHLHIMIAPSSLLQSEFKEITVLKNQLTLSWKRFGIVSDSLTDALKSGIREEITNS